MSDYKAPLQDMQFVIHDILDSEKTLQECGKTEISADLMDSVLEEAAKFASGVLAPLNTVGDKQGATWRDGQVKTSPGWKEAYKQFCDGGWGALTPDESFGGQGLPNIISSPTQEMWMSSNMAFSLGPMLTAGAINAIASCADQKIKDTFLPKMVSGQWSGTMNLTEPQAGSDLGAVRTKAEPQSDGSYKISGQKIFITYGDHDMTENIIHLVLARLPDAPAGVKGISLFVVPKVMVNSDGSLGEPNDVKCISIEHKLGIHGSPTATMVFGDKGGAIGYRVGEPNRGLEYMFIMMNEARFGVGMQGIAIADRAYQQALEYAKGRVQGRNLLNHDSQSPIVNHPDVARLLWLMKSQIEAGRIGAYYTALMLDKAHYHPDAQEKQKALMMAELLIPIVKGWNTEKANENTSHAIQVHGGMGFIEETGVAQHYRDARITAIYEGTTAIQANDLLGRKLGRDSGATMQLLVGEMMATCAHAEKSDNATIVAMKDDLAKSIALLGQCTTTLLQNLKLDAYSSFGGSVPFLMGMGDVFGAWMLIKGALSAHANIKAHKGDTVFHQQKIMVAEFYMNHVLPQGIAHLKMAEKGAVVKKAATMGL